jgi:hypothetical protein
MTGGATLPGAQLLATDNMLRETGKAFANGQMPPLFGGFGGGMVIGSSWDGSTNIYDRGLTNGIQSALGLPTMADAMNPAMDATLGIRASGQTWKNCMSANANTYSIGGSVQLAANVAFKKNASISSNTLVSAVTGNSINTFFFGSSADAGAGMAVNSPGLVSTAMGSSITYGRNSTQIMALNIARAGGAPQALSQASSGVKALLGKAGNVLSLGMSFATRTAVDIGFTGAEAINRAMQQ